MTDYATQLAAVVADAEQHDRLPYLEQQRCRRCGRVNACVVNVNGHRLYVTHVPKQRVAEAVRQTSRLYRFARLRGTAPRSAAHRVEFFYALLDHPDCPADLPSWCARGRNVQLEASTVY